MALQIELGPEQEDQLRREATRRGIAMETYAKLIVEDNLRPTPPGDALSIEEEQLLLDELADLGKNLCSSPPGETYSRETIYAEHN